MQTVAFFTLVFHYNCCHQRIFGYSAVISYALDPDWAKVHRWVLKNAGHAIQTMIHYGGYNDILRIYATTKRDGVDYNLAYIKPDFPNIKHEDFGPAYLRALFDYGYAKGRAAHLWRKAPPVLETVAGQPANKREFDFS